MNTGPVTFQSNLNDLGRAIFAYAEVYTRKDLPEILEEQAAKLSCSSFDPSTQGLFQESAATAPTAEALAELPAARGYRIRRGKNAEGVPRPLFTNGYELLRFKRGKNAGKFRVDKSGRIRHKIVGMEGEMDVRTRHRLFQAAGWLSSRLGKFGGAGAASGAGQKGDRARVNLQLNGERLSVSIINSSPSALEVAERTGYLARAVENRRRDLLAYVRRKLDERTAKLNQARLPGPR